MTELFKTLNITLDANKKAQLDCFYQMLVAENAVMNLTAITNYDEVYLKHFYDSLTLVKVVDCTKSLTLCDVGGGAGFPSIPLKIVFPNLKITIIDALGKRINFINKVIAQLGLKDIEAKHIRAEEFCQSHRNHFAVVTARAVAKMNVLLELCLPLTQVGGLFVALKGAFVKEELQEAENAIKVLNGSIKEIVTFNLPIEESVRNLVVFTNKKPTSLKYPRDFAKIKKRPL